MSDEIERVLGLVFTSPSSGEEYGVIRALWGDPPDIRGDWRALAEDSCGNYFVASTAGTIGFWDHETDEIEPLAESLAAFISGCTKPEPLEVDRSRAASVWVDPQFAKEMGLDVPPDGWVKRRED